MDQQIDLDVDNLFNDDNDLNNGLDQANLDGLLPPGSTNDVLQGAQLLDPPSGPVLERLLQLNFSGGQRRIAWSRQGHVATISADGSRVNIQCLRADIRTAGWKLTEPRPIDAIFEDAVMLAWAPTGGDLAIVDMKGRVSFFSMTPISLNVLSESRSRSVDQPDEFGFPVGALWFNMDRMDRPRNAMSKFSKNNGEWSQVITKAKTLGPLYPRAFCFVNRQGVLSLVYQKPDSKFAKSSVRIPSTSATLYTHAALSPTKDGRLLLALHACDGTLSVYSASFTWQDLRSSSSSTTPTISIEVIDENLPVLLNIKDQNGLEQLYTPDSLLLTHLEVLPPSDIENNSRVSPAIWAIYAVVNKATPSTVTGFFQGGIIRRWIVTSAEQKLHPRLDSTTVKADTNASEQASLSAERQPDASFALPILSVEFVDSGQLAVITTMDGRLETYSPTSMAPCSYERQLDEVSSMAQAGFAFTPVEDIVGTIISPSASTALICTSDEKLEISQSSYLGQPGQILDASDPSQSAAVASLILTFSRAYFANGTVDDLVTSILIAFQPSQIPAILKQMYRSLFRPTEFIHEKGKDSESQGIIHKPIASKALSFQMALLSRAAHADPTGPLQWARLWTWLAINIRQVTTSLSFLIREVQPQAQAQTQRETLTNFPSSYLETLSNMIRWMFDIYRFVFESILELDDRKLSTNSKLFDPPSAISNLGDIKADGRQGLVALLINCQWSRSFLITPAKAMRGFMQSHTEHPVVLKIVSTIHALEKKGPTIRAVETLFASNWYLTNGLAEGETLSTGQPAGSPVYPNAAIANRQIEMMCTGQIPIPYQNTISNLIDNVINDTKDNQGNVRDGLRSKLQIKRLRLFTETPDLSWVLLNMDSQISNSAFPMSNSDGNFDAGHPTNGIGDALTSTLDPFSTSSRMQKSRGKILYDVHKKSVIHISDPSQLVRRCTRCGSLSEDIGGMNKTWPKILVTVYCRCVCDGSWVVERLDEGERQGGAKDKAASKTSGDDGLLDVDMAL